MRTLVADALGKTTRGKIHLMQLPWEMALGERQHALLASTWYRATKVTYKPYTPRTGKSALGIYFSSSKHIAATYGQDVKAFRLSVVHPFSIWEGAEEYLEVAKALEDVKFITKYNRILKEGSTPVLTTNGTLNAIDPYEVLNYWIDTFGAEKIRDAMIATGYDSFLNMSGETADGWGPNAPEIAVFDPSAITEVEMKQVAEAQSNPKKYSLEAFRAGVKRETEPETRPEARPEARQEIDFVVGKTISLPGPETYVFPGESQGQISFVFKFPSYVINYNYPKLRLQVALALTKTRHGNLGGFFLKLDDGQEQVFYADIILPDQLLMAHFMDIFSQSHTIRCIFVQDDKIVRIWVVENPDEKAKQEAKQIAKYIRDDPVPFVPIHFAECKAEFDQAFGIETIDDFAKLFPSE